MKTSLWTLVVGAMAALILECGDDKEKVDSTMDSGGQRDGISQADKNQDQKTGSKDLGSGVKAKSNSGDLCGARKQCLAKEDEICTPLGQTMTGMCLGKCQPNLDNPSEAVNMCPVKDITKQYATCSLELKDKEKGTTQWVCLYFCELKTKSGEVVSRACPNDTDFKCEQLDAEHPDYKVCIPKK